MVFRCWRAAGGFIALSLYTSDLVQNSNRYKDAGVDIDAGNRLVDRIRPFAQSTSRPGAAAKLGGFAAAFDPKAAGYDDPILFAATDGVGTKLKIAIAADYHDTVGIDLVAMCVNDLVVDGAEPLFFLDYYASGALSVDAASAVIRGIAEGCRLAGCALTGGETAELPGLYAAGDYDLAGFAVGAAERTWLQQDRTINAGDYLVGMAASGLHSNGFSLVRQVVTDLDLDYSAPVPFAGSPETGQNHTLATALLAPTRIYVQSVLALYRAELAKAFAHITGGGLLENIPRMLPDGLGAHITASGWQRPAVFSWLQTSGGLTDAEMHRTFNCGIGMVAAVAPEKLDAHLAKLRELGENATVIGEVTTAPGVEIS